MFKPGRIVSKFKARNGQEIILRYPKMSDVDEITKMVNEMIAEGKVSMNRILKAEEESKWLKKTLSNMRKGISVVNIAECSGEILGISDITADERRAMGHVGEYNIIIRKNFRGVGIGTEMTKTIIQEAKATKLEMIRLHVNSENKNALILYKKAGFKIVGRIPREIKKNRKYLDNIIMYKNI